jgi:peptidoglycan hydrolase-like protein with peptidoglycan-binding domain
MMHRTFLSAVIGLVIAAALPQAAAAATLTLSLTRVDDAVVRANVTGPGDTKVVLHYEANAGDRTLKLGTTDDDGYLSAEVDGDDRDIDPGDGVYVVADGDRSRTVAWPEESGTTNGSDFYLIADEASVAEGKTVVVPAYDVGRGSLTLDRIADPSIAKVTAAGSQVSVTGKAAGTTSATICLSGSSRCRLLSITVTGGAAALTFSDPHPAVFEGAAATVVILGATAGNGSYYLTGNSNPRAAQASVSYNAITITGFREGATELTLCKGSNACATLPVTVVGEDGDDPVVVPDSLTVAVGATAKASVAGKGGYSISGTNRSNVASAGVSGSVVTVKGLAVGTRNVSVCDAEDRCGDLSITVKAVPAPTPSAGSAKPFQFTSFLEYGNNNTEVLALQLVLKALGFMAATPNGNFGPATRAAVQAFQKAHGIEQAGYVGPATRAALNGTAS